MTISRARRHMGVGTIAALVLTGGVVAAGAPTASAAALPAPTVLGGPGHALIYASGMEVGPDGTLVVADTGNDRIVKMSSSGSILATYAPGEDSGDEAENARDIAVDDSGNVYVGDAALSRVLKLSPSLALIDTWSGPTGDKIGSPIGLTYSNGKIYVADAVKRKIRVFDTNGTQVSSVSENGSCSLAAVRDADADAAGNIYVANYTNNNILKFSSSGTCIGGWGSSGSGSGQFKNPYGVRVANDPSWGESVYVADSNNNRIQIFSTSGAYRTSMGSTGTAAQPGSFTTLRRVAVASDGDVWGADLWGWRLVRFDRTSSSFSYAQTIGGTPPPATSGSVFNEPRAVAVGPTGNLNIVDTVNQRVVEMTPSGSLVSVCGERDSRPVSLNWPRGVAIDPVTGDRWIADTKQSRLQIFPVKCGAEKTRLSTKGSGTGQMYWPYSIAIRASDRLAFVADTLNNRITVWDVATRAQIASYTGGGLSQPRSVTVVEGTNKIVVADWGNNRVLELAYSRTSGFALTRAIAPGLNGPEGAGVDVNGDMWIADTGNNRVLVINPAGTTTNTLTDIAGKRLAKPGAISIAGGTVFVSDTNNDRVLSYVLKSTPPTGTGPKLERTLYGYAPADMYPVDVTSTSSHYYVVDPGRYSIFGINRATSKVDYAAGGTRGSGTEELAAARALAADSAGNVWVADTPNNRMVKYDSQLKNPKIYGTKGTGNGQFTAIYGIADGPGIGSGGAAAEVIYTIDASRIQKFTTGGTWLATFGSGLNQPRQIEVNKTNGDIYVVNARDKQVVVYNKNLSEIRRFGSVGTGNGQFMGDPRGITVSPDGTVVFVTDDGNRRIQAFSGSTGSYLYQISGTGVFTDPRGLEVTADKKLIIADEWDYSLKEYTFTSTGATKVREMFGNPAPKTGANSPRGLALDSDGHVFASDWWNQRIIRANRDGAIDKVWGFRGIRGEVGSLNFQWAVAVQPGTNNVFVGNRESHEIKVFTHDGTQLWAWGKRGTASGDFTFPQGLAFDNDGSLLVADSGNGRIQRFRVNSSSLTWLASYGTKGTGTGQLQMPTGVDTAPDGTIWIADTKNNRVVSYKPSTGTWTTVTKPTGSTRPFAVPWGVTVAPDGYIWVADTGRQRLVRMSTSGTLSYEVTGTSAGTSDFLGPFQVVFDASGDLFMSDTWSNRVLRLGFS
ncbi:MAG: hypothetical protein WBB91_08435 [Nostocoides sp.]|uniref:hypothetical protein n=1 Tax=Nostocoides sp. TaxID=1917966 RepID=UPI003C788562